MSITNIKVGGLREGGEGERGRERGGGERGRKREGGEGERERGRREREEERGERERGEREGERERGERERGGGGEREYIFTCLKVDFMCNPQSSTTAVQTVPYIDHLHQAVIKPNKV